MSRGRATDPHGALALDLALRLAPAEVAVRDSREAAWASATFEGARHRFALAVSGKGAAEAVIRLRTGLAEAEFDLTGHLVADIAFASRKTDWRVSPPAILIEIEALTVALDQRDAPSARRSDARSPIGTGLPWILRAWRRASAASSRAISPETDSLSTGRRKGCGAGLSTATGSGSGIAGEAM